MRSIYCFDLVLYCCFLGGCDVTVFTLVIRPSNKHAAMNYLWIEGMLQAGGFIGFNLDVPDFTGTVYRHYIWVLRVKETVNA